VFRSIVAVGSLSRSQLLVYGAVAVVLLLVGARWIRSGDAQGAPAGGVTYADSSKGAGSGGALAVDAQGGTDVVVDVAGAVSDPGVYRLPAGARVNDAIQRAGGATAQGEIDAINLAARLTDGQQVIIPVRAKSPAGVAAGSSVTGSAGASSTNPAAPINMGTASVEDLDTIEGIGPVTAQKIVEFRDQHGGVSSVDQLDQIDGIGPATMDALRSRLQP
jgi:competence protein ComEA